MTTSRLAVLLAVLCGGLSSVALLPKHLGYQPVGINLGLPETLGPWWGQDVEIGENEHSTLGYDTEFARKRYNNGRGASILASIVLAGQDMTTGIHRPERCLNAQGWTVGDGSRRVIDVPNFGPLRTTRLINTKKVRQDDQVIPVTAVCYYWFVGYTDTAASHFQRVWLDGKDRVLKGYNQRWAMILISADITKERERFGYDEQGVDELIQGFIKQVTPLILKDSVHSG
jgi:EpsI family protein